MPQTTAQGIDTASAERLRAVVDRIRHNDRISPSESDQIAQLLVDYECWDSLFTLLGTHSKDNQELFLANQKFAIRTHIKYVNDDQACVELLDKIITTYKVNFSFIWDEVRHQLEDDVLLQARVLTAIWDRFDQLDCRVKCLERLCLVYEKKLADDEQTRKHYRLLINVDANNIRALKYFKSVYVYNFQWDQAIAAIKKILQVSRGLDKYRAAQELAAIYLYSKHKPSRALAVLERYCEDSPLDKSMILYDSYIRLEDWGSCIKILQGKINSNNNTTQQSQLHLKIAGLYTRAGNSAAAVTEYRAAFAKDVNCIEALEAMIGIYAKEDAWEDVLECLLDIQARLAERSHYLRVERLVNRIKKHTA
ncbi:MAG: hypothetical protein OYH77_01205 [Pseudomonadota bacterium]|nr:hypothetical protein [Pseudomonadota bacterium]